MEGLLWSKLVRMKTGLWWNFCLALTYWKTFLTAEGSCTKWLKNIKNQTKVCRIFLIRSVVSSQCNCLAFEFLSYWSHMPCPKHNLPQIVDNEQKVISWLHEGSFKRSFINQLEFSENLLIYCQMNYCLTKVHFNFEVLMVKHIIILSWEICYRCFKMVWQDGVSFTNTMS